MTKTAPTKIYLNKQQQSEFDQFAAAAERLVAQAQFDKNVAQGFLRDIGYLDIMTDGKVPSIAPKSARGLLRRAKSKDKSSKRKRVKS